MRSKQCESLADRLRRLILVKIDPNRERNAAGVEWSACTHFSLSLSLSLSLSFSRMLLSRFQRLVNCECLRVPTKNSLLTSSRNIAAASRVNECSREKSIYGPSGEPKNTIAVKLSWYMYIGIRPVSTNVCARICAL